MLLADKLIRNIKITDVIITEVLYYLLKNELRRPSYSNKQPSANTDYLKIHHHLCVTNNCNKCNKVNVWYTLVCCIMYPTRYRVGWEQSCENNTTDSLVFYPIEADGL